MVYFKINTKDFVRLKLGGMIVLICEFKPNTFRLKAPAVAVFGLKLVQATP